MRKNHDRETAGTAGTAGAEDTSGELLGRRALLRRAGTIAAIAGGAAVVQASGTGSAEAASGGNVVMGSANVADATATSVTSSTTAGATLGLANTGTEHGPLALTKSPDGIFSSGTAASGELFSGGTETDLYYVNEVTKPGAAVVFTETTANQVIGITPQRILDTRNSAGRTNILTGAQHVGSTGLVGGQWIQLDLSGLVILAESVFINLTAVSPTAAGYLTASNQSLAAGVAPTTSSLNFVKGVNLANFAVVPTDPADFLSFWIYARTTTQILADVTAVNVPSSLWVNPGVLPVFQTPKLVDARRAAFARAHAKTWG